MTMITDWDDAYANRDHVRDAMRYVDAWAPDALAVRQALAGAGRLREDIAYGASERERLDLLLPQGQARGLVVYVHGGYWHLFDKSHWTQFGTGALEAGWAVAVPSYTLCPQARITQIVRQVGAAIESAAAQVDGPIRLTGHSAGGHLVARMACRDTPLGETVRARVQRIVAISGVHDLRPLMRTKMNETLRLDLDEAERQSPALLTPLAGTDIVCWVGGDERPEFLRQNALLADIWSGCGVATRAVVDTQKHHFNVIDGLKRADSALCRTLLGATD